MEVGQERTRLHPQPVDQRRSGLGVGVERFGLPARAIAGHHAQSVRLLAQGVGGHQDVELTEHLGVAAADEVGGQALLGRRVTSSSGGIVTRRNLTGFSQGRWRRFFPHAAREGTIMEAPALTTFAIYLAGMVGIGIWVYRRTSNLSDFVLGGRGLGSGTAALSAQASDMSGWLLLGLPGAVYASGIGASWIGIGLLIGTYLNWRFVAARLRSYTERCDDSLTLSTYFEGRFEDRTQLLRLVSAGVTILFFSLYVASGLVAAGLLFEQVLGVDPGVAVATGAIVIVAYTFLGGFLAVSYTDAVQGMLMLVALIIVPIVAVMADGGFGAMTSSISAESPSLLSLGAEAGFADGSWGAGEALGFGAIASSLAWGLGYFGQPHILARFMGIRSVGDVPAARRIGTGWVASCLGGAVLVGLAGIAFFDTPLDNPETVFLGLITANLNPWLGGFLLAAVLAAVMSTADSQLLVASSSLTEDIYRATFRRAAPQKTLLWVGRGTTIAVAIVAYVLALGGGTVLELVEFAWAGFGAAFGPVVLFSLYWSRTTMPGALAGMIGGAFTVLVWPLLGDTGIPGTDLYEMIPGVLVSTALVLGFSRLGTVPAQRNWSIPEKEWPAADAERGAGQV